MQVTNTNTQIDPNVFVVPLKGNQARNFDCLHSIAIYPIYR